MTTDQGDVKGNQLDQVRAFLGIPYAAPPTGDLRWRAPADAAPWTGVRDAITWGPSCSQYNLLNGAPVFGTSEDCLSLNVWTPLAATTKAPVMVFLHGGAFVNGSGSDLSYDGGNLAAAGNVIVVTINYRLGPLGFFQHPALTADAPAGNLGLLDQRAALAWVQRNAAAFGGDPANVTVFGESAGAMSVCAHLAMPKSAGLFQRALMESGACSGSIFTSAKDAAVQANALATAVGCADAATAAACLRGKSALEILNGLPLRHMTIGANGVLWGPTYGDGELPEVPLAALQDGRFPRVPVVLGTNLNEGQLFSFLYDGTLGSADVTAIFSWLFGAGNVGALQTEYLLSSYASAKEQVADVVTDGVFVCPTRRATRAIAAAGGTAYLYQFAYPFEVHLVPGARAAHGFELAFVFGNNFYGTRLTDAEQPLSASIMGYWSRFARTGDPNGDIAARWPAYDATADTNLVLDATVSTAPGLKKAHCDFWDALP